MARTLSRIAHEILERHPDPRRLALVGVRSRGVPLARRLAAPAREAAGSEPAVGALDISLYRDDFTSLAAQPITKGTDILFSIDGRTVVLVDDVLYTGRTVRAALDELIDFGRPARIELAVLVDRGHRELPIRADYVGQHARDRARRGRAGAACSEEDGRDEVLLHRKLAAAARRRPRPARRSRSRARRRGAKSRGDELPAPAPARDRAARSRRRSRRSWTPPRRCARSSTGRSRRCPRCAARRSSTCSSRPRRARAPRSRSPSACSRPTASRSPPPPRARPRARRCSTRRATSRR